MSIVKLKCLTLPDNGPHVLFRDKTSILDAQF